MDTPREIQTAQDLLSAAANHDIQKLQTLLYSLPPTINDHDTGNSPIHVAIHACADDTCSIESGARTVECLLRNGAIWNDLNHDNETPGCLAKRLGLQEIYELIVDAGVRAELLFRTLARLEEKSSNNQIQSCYVDTPGEIKREDPNEKQTAAAAIELNNNTAYLSQPLTFSENKLVDSDGNAVMMTWERQLMERHAASLLPHRGLRVLNIGFGMGIIDNFFQDQKPSTHHIIEAHPNVLKHMQETGWMEKPGVVVHRGRWQEALPRMVQSAKEPACFDAIYFDTFAEGYEEMREFFSTWVAQLLDTSGRFGFFNGMGADRQIIYDVYSKVIEPTFPNRYST